MTCEKCKKSFLRAVASFLTLRMLKSQINFCLEACTNIEEILTKKFDSSLIILTSPINTQHHISTRDV